MFVYGLTTFGNVKINVHEKSIVQKSSSNKIFEKPISYPIQRKYCFFNVGHPPINFSSPVNVVISPNS